MNFYTEPTGYEKTIISDLQGAWENLREAVVDDAGFGEWERILLHIEEAMSWESVRDIERMQSTFMVIRNIAVKAKIPDTLTHWLQEVSMILDNVLKRIANGERL